MFAKKKKKKKKKKNLRTLGVKMAARLLAVIMASGRDTTSDNSCVRKRRVCRWLCGSSRHNSSTARKRSRSGSWKASTNAKYNRCVSSGSGNDRKNCFSSPARSCGGASS